MKIGVYAGSFDPITKGHEDIIRRAANLTDKLVVGILNNSQKKYWFTLEERKEMVEKVVGDIQGIEIRAFDGLLVDFIEKVEGNIIVRGLRALSDYEYELQMFLGNKILSKKKIETIFLPASRENLYLSSSLVRDVALNQGELKHFINENIVDEVALRGKKMKK